MAKPKYNQIILFIPIAFLLIKSSLESSEEKLPSKVSRAQQIFKKYLIPQTKNMKEIIKKIQDSDYRLQRNILLILEEEPENGTSPAKSSFREYEPVLKYGSSDFDWVIIEMEVFMHRLKEDKGKVRNVYESVKKTLQILTSKRGKDMKNKEENGDWYDYLKEYYEKKSKLVKKLLNIIFEAENQAQDAYSVLNSASKSLMLKESLTVEETIAWKVNLAVMQRSMNELKKLELDLVHTETFRTNSLISASSSVTNVKPNLHRFFWTIFPILLNVAMSIAFYFIRRTVVNAVVSFIVKKVLSSFLPSDNKNGMGQRSFRTPENPILGSRIRNFGRKFGDRLRYEFNNLPEYIGAFTPLSEKELYCKNIQV